MVVRVPFNRPFIAGTELYYIADAVLSGKISGDGKYGRQCEAMLQDLLDVGRVLLTTSCTHALEMAALLSDVGPGDEVILPSYTFVSTANAFHLRGARLVFADIEPDYLNMDLDHVEGLITPRTKVIVTVHYAGNSCDMDRLMAIADKHGIVVVEDAAQAINATYKSRPLGSIGQLGTLSFHETKNLNCGEGGALLVNDPDHVGRAEIIRDKGTNRSSFFRGQVDKYTWVDQGSSYVLSDILAAFLKAQLENMGQTQEKRAQLYARYYEGLEGMCRDRGIALPEIPPYNNGNQHIFYLQMPSLAERQGFISFLDRHEVNAVFHYTPLHTSVMGQSLGYTAGQLPVTEVVSETLVRLPLHAMMQPEDCDYVIDVIGQYFGESSPHE